MSTTAMLPSKVVDILGQEATRELIQWLDDYLHEQLATTRDQPRITAFQARQKVNVLMLEQVSNLLISDEPSLIKDKAGKSVWHVPIELGFAGHGRIGCVGTIDVDAHYGVIYYDDLLLAQIRDEAKRLTEGLFGPDSDTESDGTADPAHNNI